MYDEKEINTINKKENISEENNSYEKDILNSDFFKLFENSQKIPEKKEKIEKLINYLKENKNYLKSLKETKNLELLYEIILTNLIENNNNFIISQINLMKILSDQISNNETEEIKNDFIKFFKKALPKLFDKFYLQNTKINKNLTEIFIFILDKKILKYNDYFPLLENICIEEDEDYKINILNFILKLLKSQENICIEDFPENIINTINKLNENKENNNLKEISGNIIEIFNERKKLINTENKNFDIPNNPLSQQDSKLAFSSFIKKISKAVRNENLNKNVNTTNNHIKDDEIKEKENEIINNLEKKENIYENGQIETRIETIESKIEKIKESSQEQKLIINDNNLNNNLESENVNMKKSNESSKKKNNNEINEDINAALEEEKKENKEMKNNNKKGIKTRISRSRKLGVMVKQKTNKEKEKVKEKIKEENDNNNNITKEQKNNQNIVNKTNNINKKENSNLPNKEIEKEEKNISPIKEDNNENISENNLNEKPLLKKEENKMKTETVLNLDQKIIKDDFDEIPIKPNINNNIINDNEENGIQIPKKISIDEFNKKIDSALEIENQDLLIKHTDEINNNEKEEKEEKEEKDKEIDEPIFNELKSILGSEICDLISSQKWENKKHAFEEINNLINERNIELNYNDLFNFIKAKMKNFKETNFNIIREALNIFISLLKIKGLSKENLIFLINIYFEKISDIKLKDNFIELINTAIEESIIDAGSIISNIISKISKKKNTKLLNEYSILFSKLIEENNIKDLPINDIVKYCKLMAGNSNPQVRTSATNLICILYKYMGEDLKPLIKDIKESTLKIIETELEKVIIIKNNEDDKIKNNKKIVKKNSKIGKKVNGESIQESTNNFQSSEPLDISKKINIYLKDLSEGKWLEKKEAIENIENIISEANNNILSIGLNDIFLLIKSKLSDGNKNYVKMLISLLTKFISALKKDFKPWTKMIALSLIPILSDKNQSIRKECEQCFDAWAKNIGIDSLIIHFPQFLKNDNVEIRIEIMKYIKKYNEQFSKNLGDNIYKELIDSLLICLQDRSNNVRNEAENIIMLSLDFVEIDRYYKKIKDFKPAIEKDLKIILDNINEKFKNNIEKDILSNNENNNLNEDFDKDNNNYYNENDFYNLQNYTSFNKENKENTINKSSTRILKKNKDSSQEKILTNIEEKVRNSFKTKKSENLGKNNNINSSNLVLNNKEKINLDNNYLSGNEEQEFNINKEKNRALNSSNTKRKKILIKTAEKEKKFNKIHSKFIDKKENTNSDNKEGNILSSNSTVLRKYKNSIEKRVKINRKNTSDKNNKISNEIFNLNNNIKIPLNKNKREELDKKFKFSIDTISSSDTNKLKEYSKIIFIEDINTKIFENDLNKEIELFKKMKYNLDKQLNLEFFLDNLDIILKIISLKINNNYNPSLLKHFFSLLESIYDIINETNYHLTETEATIILCLLIDKLSINNNQIKENALNLINQYFEVIDTNKIFLSILNFSLNRNNTIKSIVLDMTLELHLNKKINMTSKDYIKILSKYLSLNNNVIKSKCIKIFGELQGYLKEEILNVKDKNLSENEKNEEEEESNDNIEEDEIQDGNNSDNIDNNEEEIYNSDNNEKYSNNNQNDLNDSDNDNDNDNIDKYYLSEDRYNNNENNSEFIKNDEIEKNLDNESSYIKNALKLNKTSHNYYTRTDNKTEDKLEKSNLTKHPNNIKNSENVTKIQKIKTIKENNIDNYDIDKKAMDKFSLPKKNIKQNNNNKKLKVFNNKLNKSQKLKKKFNINSSNKEINLKSNKNINNNLNNFDNNSNNSNGNSINNNENNDISVYLYKDKNQNSSNNNIEINNNNSSTLSEKELLEIMNNLFSEDESEKMGTIIIIHEILCSKYQQNKYILIPNIDNIIKIIIQITHELFENIDTLNNKIVPLKFTKYLTTILFKLTSNKEFIFHISYKVLFDLCYELLNYLLINDLDKIGSNQEGNIIFKSLNSAMLRVLENCDTTSVILALLEIIKQNQNDKNSGLLCNLSMKCLYKVTQNINQIINKIQLDKILLQMHLLTYNFDKLSNGRETNSQSNIMIIRFIKNLIIDLVKIKKDKILEDYNKSIANNQYKDKYIYNWIINALETLELTENEEDNSIFNINDLSKSTNLRSSSTNINKNRLINTDKKGENGGFILSNINNNIGSINNLNKKSVIIVKKHVNNNINNRYNFNNYNTQSSGNNIVATKSSILGSSNISNNHKINVQKTNNSKNSQIYYKNRKKNKSNK